MARPLATAVRRREIAASPQALWELIGDPHHQPRWWPGVERMEGVADDRFTQVFRSRRGRPVRADFQVVERSAPSLVAWRQLVEGTAFARVLEESLLQLNLEPAGEGTIVAIAHQQRLRGYSRTGGLMVRRATNRRLDEALRGLERAVR